MKDYMDKWKEWVGNLDFSLWMKPVFKRGIKKMGGVANVVKNSKVLLSENEEYFTMYYLIKKDYEESINESDNPEINLKRKKPKKKKKSLPYTVAGYISYQKLTDKNFPNSPLCRPNPNSESPTYVLKAIARSSSFKGWGIGKIISLLSVCVISQKGGYITSDRDTSNQAGQELVKSLKLIGAEISDPFDYVGWLKNSIRRSYDKTLKRRKKKQVPLVKDQTKKSFFKESEEGELRNQAPGWKLKVAELYNHLQPLTVDEKDDCAPSINIYIEGTPVANKSSDQTQLIPGKWVDNLDLKYSQEVIEKLLKMSSQEIQDTLNKDPNVQGYRFSIKNKGIVSSVIRFINLTNYAKEVDSIEKAREMQKYELEGGNMFQRVYSREVAKDKQKLVKNFFSDDDKKVARRGIKKSK